MHPAIRKDGVAVITGAAKGIGFAIAECVARHGMHLALLDADADSLRDAATRLKQYDIPVSTVVGDVADHVAITQLRDEAIVLGELSLVVNNAASI